MPRPRKSEFEHSLAGTTPQWTKDNKPVFEGGRPKMPPDLTPEAEQEWKRLVRELQRRGTLTRVDSSALEVYVVMFARWKKVAAMAHANPVTEIFWTGKDGVERTKVVEHPASAMATRLENSLRNLLKELSATPASRERTKPMPPKPKKEVIDPDSNYGRLVAMMARPPAPPEPEPPMTAEELARFNAAMESL